MEQTVRVRQVFDDGTAQVIHIRQSACSGDCHKCSGCGAAQETVMLTAQNSIGAKPGELVKISSATAPVLGAAAVLYVLPLVLFFAGYSAGALLWGRGALVGGLTFAGGIGLAVVYDRAVAKKNRPVYTITGYAEGSAPRSKGDNEVD